MHSVDLWNIRRSKRLHSEEDVKLKVVMPYLNDLNYSVDEMRFENPIEVQIGTKKKLYAQTLKLW